MAINKPFDRHFTTIGGNVKKTGSSLSLAKGQVALADLSKTTPQGVELLSSLAGFPKEKKTLVLREGVTDKSPNRTHSNAGKSTPPFSLEEVRAVRVSAPKRTEQSVDEITIGYDGFDPKTAFNFKKGDRYFNLFVEISGGLLQYRGAKNDIEFAYVNVEIPSCDPFNTCQDCEDCEPVDCKAITLEAIETLRRRQVAGGTTWDEFVDITPIFSCNEEQENLIEYTYWNLTICDTGDDNALALVQAQYNYPVKVVGRKGSSTTYEVLLPNDDGAPADFTQGVASIIKGCESCPDDYTASPEGYVYAITIEDDGAAFTTQITNNLASAKFVAGTLLKSGNNAGVGFYTAIYSAPITSAEIATFVGANTDGRSTATIDLVGQVSAICDNSTITETEWVEGKSCSAIEETYSIILKDNACGDNRAAELQGAYPNATIFSETSRRLITLTGTSGEANITIGGVDYLATFDTNLATTAENFVTDHAVAIEGATGVEISIGLPGRILFEGATSAVSTLSVSNVSGNLGGGGVVVPVWVSQGCKTKYMMNVISNLVCEECSDEFLDFWTTKTPETYDTIEWQKETEEVVSTDCLCGIRIKGKPFYLEGDEALRDLVGFTETSVKVRASAGFPVEVREGIGNIPKGTAVVKYDSRFEPRTHLAGNLLTLERESRAYFLGQGRQLDYQGRVLRGETSAFSDLGVQYVDYVVEIAHSGITQGFARNNTKNIAYHIWAEVGRHQDVEDLVNSIAANAGLPPVKAFGA